MNNQEFVNNFFKITFSLIAGRSKSNNESVREEPPSITVPSSSSTSVPTSNNTDKDITTPISPARQNNDSSVVSAATALSTVSIECTSPGTKNNTANNNNNSVANKKIVNSTNTVNNNIENEGSNSAATPDRNGVSSPSNNDSIISTDSQTETQAQRCRRSSRNLEDPTRRRSSRGTRQSSSTQNNRVGTRPSMDLPSGYGKLFFLIWKKKFILIFWLKILEMRTTQQGQVYFYHIPTGISTWHDPRYNLLIFFCCHSYKYIFYFFV